MIAQEQRISLLSLAPQRGFEPRFTASKAAVLPLDDRGMLGWDELFQSNTGGYITRSKT